MLSSKYRYRVISGFRPILISNWLSGYHGPSTFRSDLRAHGQICFETCGSNGISEPDLPVQARSIRIIQIHDSRSSDNTFFDIMIMDEFHLIVSFTVNTQNSLSHQEFLTIWRNFKILRILTGAGTGTAKMLNYFAVQQDSWIQVSSNLPGSAGSLKWVVSVVWA